MKRHGPIYSGKCSACGADNVEVQLYTDDVLTDPIVLCIDANARTCMDRQNTGGAYQTQLARYFLAAFLANHLGIGLDYAAKKYAAEAPGPYWQRLAGQVIKERVL